MIYVSSDWHGHSLDKLKELLDKVSFGKDDRLYVLGDVIDRGEEGIEIIKWLMKEVNITLLIGNHEYMMLKNTWIFDEITDESVDSVSDVKMRSMNNWMSNGGEVTIRALAKETPETRANIIEYLRSECPLYEWVNAGGRDYLLVHAGLGGYSPEKSMDEYTPEELVWVRPTENTVYSDEFTTIVGHTPTCIFGKPFYGKIIKAQTFIDIDVGVAYGFSPVLLRLDDMKVFYGE